MYRINKELVAFCGLAGSGKTAISKKLEKNLNFNVLSFATPIKEIAVKIRQRELDKTKDRQLLIDIGSFLRGGFDEVSGDFTDDMGKVAVSHVDWIAEPFQDQIFIDLLLAKVEPNKRYAVDDLRFLPEYAMLKNAGFTIVLLECMVEICEKRLTERDGGFSKELWTKRSENEFKKFNPDVILFSGTPTDITYSNYHKKMEHFGRKDYLDTVL